MAKKEKYYSLKEILKSNAQYNFIISGRSNGKTYAAHDYMLKEFWKSGKQGAYIRRWQDDFTGKRGNTLFDAQVSTGNVSKITGGEWTQIYYYASKWYLARYDEDQQKIVRMQRPFCYGFSISAMEHDKSTSYPDVTTIIFDEVISRNGYLPDEFVLFMNVLSTIIRERTDVKIFMLGNTINKYCPYFAEMGLNHVKDMSPGSIDVYTYGESKLKVAVEYALNKASTESAFYFAFDNPKLNMITGQEWEIDIYPHLPAKYKPQDVIYTYFIEWENDLLQCEVINLQGEIFTYIHRKTTPLQNKPYDLIYSTRFNKAPNYRRRITIPVTNLEKKILAQFRDEKIFYQDNETGEIIRNYLQWCGKKV